MFRCTRNAAALLLAVCMILVPAFTGCSDEAVPSRAEMTDAHGITQGSQARLWLSIENAESSYIGSDPDPWLTDSWVAQVQEFDVVLTNTSGFPVDSLFLLVTIPAEYLDVPGWYLQVDDRILVADDFAQGSTSEYGFDGGSHGVYPPSGTGVFYPCPLPGELASDESRSVHVTTWTGDAAGFRVHFDGGSTRLWSPPSHDVTVMPPVGGEVPAQGACCVGVDCSFITLAECAERYGMYYGDNVPCEGQCGGGGD